MAKFSPNLQPELNHRSQSLQTRDSVTQTRDSGARFHPIFRACNKIAAADGAAGD